MTSDSRFNYWPKVMGYLLILITIIGSMLSCQKDEVNIDVTPAFGNSIDLGNIAVGQKSYFQLFTFSRENFIFTSRQFQSDTLIVEVVEATQDGYVVEERLSPGSALWQDQEQNRFDEILRSTWSFSNDSLRVVPQQDAYPYSYLFHFRVQPFPLSNYTAEEVQLVDALPVAPYQRRERETFATHTSINGVDLPHLNMLVDWDAMAFDGPGVEYYFEPHGLLLQTLTVSAWTGAGHGWSLVVP